MRNRREDEVLLEMYEQIRLNENIDDERKKSLELVGMIIRYLNTTHDDQWPEDLFKDLRDSLNRIEFHNIKRFFSFNLTAMLERVFC